MPAENELKIVSWVFMLAALDKNIFLRFKNLF